MANQRIATGAGLVLSLEALHSFQLVLPPLYGKDEVSEEELHSAVRFIAVYILLLAFIAGALTGSPAPIILPAITLALVYGFYRMEMAKRSTATHSEGVDE